MGCLGICGWRIGVAVSGLARLVWVRRLEGLRTRGRKIRRVLWLLSCLAIGLGVGGTGPGIEGRLSRLARLAEASSTGIIPGRPLWLQSHQDPIYDEFLEQFVPLRGSPDRRRYLAEQVLAAATTHLVDPDLLLAVIAVESGFDSKAVSPRGARGLGQMMFATARAVAPDVVRRPEDLHDVRRNLYATALHLRTLLDEGRGDLRVVLRVYHGGPASRNLRRRDREQYVARVSTHYASLKARRTYLYVTSAAGETTTAKR